MAKVSPGWSREELQELEQLLVTVQIQRFEREQQRVARIVALREKAAASPASSTGSAPTTPALVKPLLG